MTRPKPHSERRSPRLKDYDYTQSGAYFATICTQKRRMLFGSIRGQEMHCNALGDIVWQCWHDLPNHYANIELDTFVVMPNHVHGIIIMRDTDVGEGLRLSPTHDAVSKKRHGLTEIVRALKSFSVRCINVLRETAGTKVWQRSFHDHIIRNEASLNKLREYVIYNPALWEKDTFYEASSDA